MPNKIGVTRLLPKSLRAMKDMLPDLKPHYGQLPEVLEPEGKPAARVALFLGCVADSLYPETNLRHGPVLQKNGCEVWIPRNQVLLRGAALPRRRGSRRRRAFAAANCDAFGATDLDDFDRARRDHHQRGRLRRAAQGLRPHDARHAASRSGGAFAIEGPRHQRVPDGTRPGEADAPAAASRRPITTPATCGTPSRSSSSRGSCSK